MNDTGFVDAVIEVSGVQWATQKHVVESVLRARPGVASVAANPVLGGEWPVVGIECSLERATRSLASTTNQCISGTMPTCVWTGTSASTAPCRK